MSSAVQSPMQEYRRVKTLEKEETEAGSTAGSEVGSIRGSEAGSVRSNGSGTSAAGAAGKAVGRGFGKVGLALTKTAIDLPRAVADGLHNVPELYGEKVREIGPIRGWKSGSKTGLKVRACPFVMWYY